FLSLSPLSPSPHLLPYTTLFRSKRCALVSKPTGRPRRLPRSWRNYPGRILYPLYVGLPGRYRICRFRPVGHHLRSLRIIRTERIPSWLDRKSTRLNSSHVSISYAVFCLKKKNSKTNEIIIVVVLLQRNHYG